MGKVAIDCLAARQTIYSPFVRYVKHYSSLSFRLYAQAGFALETLLPARCPRHPLPIYSLRHPLLLAGTALAEVGILIIDDDVVSQRALKNVLDSEGWRVRIVPLASAAMLELASGQWSLVIVNIAMTDVRGPLFNILKDLAQGDADALEGAEVDSARPKRIRVLFLVPLLAARDAQPILEKEGLPYLLKPYHLHDFLEKVGELLVEAGALADPIRSMSDFSPTNRKRRGLRSAQRGRRSSMFASRDDYQMSEEELLEWERTEEEERKKREKELEDRKHL
jgi:DNA-binding response OmpR family regulator